MDFSTALQNIKEGARAFRSGWNGKGMFVALAQAPETCFITRPYLYMFTAEGERVPWLASQTDLLAEDWATE